MKKWIFACILASELLMVSPLQASIQSQVSGFFEYISKKVHRHVTKNRIAVVVVAGSVAYLLFGKHKGPTKIVSDLVEYPQASEVIAREANGPGNLIPISNTLPENIDLNHIVVFNYKGVKLIVVQGISITKLPVKVIVNAANAQLDHGGGVALVINNAADKSGCLERVDKIALEKFKEAKQRPFAAGDALIVPGCALKERGIEYIVHAVGPSINHRPITEEDQKKLGSAYQSGLMVADSNGATSVAFPTISTNIFGYPVAQATPVALRAIEEAIISGLMNNIKEIWFAIYGDDNKVMPSATQQEKFDYYLSLIPQVFKVSKISDKDLEVFIQQKQSHSF